MDPFELPDDTRDPLPFQLTNAAAGRRYQHSLPITQFLADLRRFKIQGLAMDKANPI